MGKKKDLYKEEIIDPGDRASKLAHEVCMQSYQNSPAMEIIPRQPGNFRGAVDFLWNENVLLSMIRRVTKETVQNDGAGGKPQFATLAGIKSAFYNLGWELITMCADDIARAGGKAVMMLNQIDTKRITDDNFSLFAALMRGYGDALKNSRLINITGELAIMKHSITAFCDSGKNEQLILTWSGACFGLTHKDKNIDGKNIRPGMPIVGFHERGYRCNGGTFFTNLLLKEYKDLWHPNAIDFARELTTPSISYAALIDYVNGWNPDGTVLDGKLAKMVGGAHITGGGVWGKLGDLLPKGVGAFLDDMPKPPQVLLEAQQMSKKYPDLALSDWQAYSTFHGGCGMLMVCETMQDAEELVRQVKHKKVAASIVGETTKSKNSEIEIISRFMDNGKGLYASKPY